MQKKRYFNRHGYKNLQVPCSEDGHVSMQRCLELMAEEGITTVLVEAGGYLASSLVKVICRQVGDLSRADDNWR